MQSELNLQRTVSQEFSQTSQQVNKAINQKIDATAAKLPKGSKERGMLYDITSKMQGIVSVIAPYKESEIIRAEQWDWLPTSSPFYDGNSGFVAVQQQWAINDGKTPEEARFQTEMPVAGRGGELKSTTRNTKPQTQKEIDKIGIPYNKSSNPFDPVQETDKFGNEIYYRTMSEKDYQTLQMTGKLPASQTKEISISPVRSYSSQYDGILVKLVVKPNTSAELQKIGISANLKTTEVLNLPFKGGEKDKWQSMDIPFKGKGWSETNTRFKVEGGQTTTQLGSGKGLEIFNRNIVDFQLINK